MEQMAVDRIRDELAQRAGENPALDAIGEYVTGRVLHGAALPEGATLAGAYEEMAKRAGQKRRGAMYCMPPKEALEIIDGYFGFVKGKEGAGHAAARESELDLDALLREGTSSTKREGAGPTSDQQGG